MTQVSRKLKNDQYIDENYHKFHGRAFIDLSPLTTPGATSVNGRYKLSNAFCASSKEY